MCSWYLDIENVQEKELVSDSPHQQAGLTFKEETSEVQLHWEYSSVWCWNLNTSERISEIRGKF
jgi:hypothetical protein